MTAKSSISQDGCWRWLCPSGPDLDGVVGEAGGEGLKARGGVVADLGQLSALGVAQGGHHL